MGLKGLFAFAAFLAAAAFWLGGIAERVSDRASARMSADPVPYTDFAVHVAPANGGTHVAIFGELDLATLDKARLGIEEALAAEGDVVIDMRACQFVDSKGIGLIAQAAVHLQREERGLTLKGVHERVARILEVAGLADSDLMQIERQPKAD